MDGKEAKKNDVQEKMQSACLKMFRLTEEKNIAKLNKYRKIDGAKTVCSALAERENILRFLVRLIGKRAETKSPISNIFYERVYFSAEVSVESVEADVSHVKIYHSVHEVAHIKAASSAECTKMVRKKTTMHIACRYLALVVFRREEIVDVAYLRTARLAAETKNSKTLVCAKGTVVKMNVQKIPGTGRRNRMNIRKEEYEINCHVFVRVRHNEDLVCSVCICERLSPIFSCMLCRLRIHEKCFALLLFPCKERLRQLPIEKEIEKKISMYKKEHVLKDMTSQISAALDYVCYHCGSYIRTDGVVSCDVCDSYYHAQCRPFIPDSCLLAYKDIFRLQNENLQRRQVYKDDDIVMDGRSIRLVRKIAKGTFSSIFLAKDREAAETYAVKLVKKEKMQSQEIAEGIRCEIEIMREMKSPSIMQLCAFEETLGSVYIVTPFMRNGTLSEMLMYDYPLSDCVLKFLAVEILCGLAVLHRHNICYKDLKLDNILIDDSRHIVLADFGLAQKNVRHGTVMKTVSGTAEYVAPEILRGSGYTRTCDYWSYGVCLFELSQKRSPFLGVKEAEIIESVRAGTYTFSEPIDGKLRALIEQLLNPDPSKRLGSTGVSEIMSDEYFSGIVFSTYREKTESPLSPRPMSNNTVRYVDDMYVRNKSFVCVEKHSI